MNPMDSILLFPNRDLSVLSCTCCLNTTVHATVLYSSRSRRSSVTKLSDRVTFQRTTKYCVAGMLYSLFDVSQRLFVFIPPRDTYSYFHSSLFLPSYCRSNTTSCGHHLRSLGTLPPSSSLPRPSQVSYSSR
jgi:hypothetical protein